MKSRVESGERGGGGLKLDRGAGVERTADFMKEVKPDDRRRRLSPIGCEGGA